MEFIRNLGIDLNNINLRSAVSILIFETNDVGYAVEETKEVVEGETHIISNGI